MMNLSMNEEMDELERAILITFDESGKIDSDLKCKAIEYCQRIKENQSISCICAERLFTSKFAHVQFWCLQCLQDAVRVRYSSSMSVEEKNFIRKSVFAMATYEVMDDSKNFVRVLDSPAFIKNKLAQVLVNLIYHEYPLIWPSVFVDFMMACLNRGTVVIDMFCRLLIALDDELISLDYPRNADESKVANRVKDEMRVKCVPQIVKMWYDIIMAYRNSDPELCVSVLESMRRYISWIDISLIANDVFMPLLFELILGEVLPEQLRSAATGCVLAVVMKRMDSQAKFDLLRNLQINRVFGLISEEIDVELVSSIANLLTGYAAEILECAKDLNSEEFKRNSSDLLEEVLPSVFYVIRSSEVDATFSTVQFLSGYVATMKNSPLSENQLAHLNQILELIRAKVCYDPIYRDHLDVRDKIGMEEEDRMLEYRKDLLVLLRSIGRVAPDVTHSFIENSLGNAVASSSERNVEEVEAALSLLYALGESLSGEAVRAGSRLLGELVPALLWMRFPCHSNRLVALTYLETIIRYMKYVQETPDCIPKALEAFLDERGIRHPNIIVSRRASYLFTRLVKLLKSKLAPYIETILQKLHDVVIRFTSMSFSDKVTIEAEDGSHIFEAIGILIGMELVPSEKQADYLSSLLTPLCHQVKTLIENPEGSATNILVIQQIVVAINALSKGFNERLATASRPAIGLMFKQTLDILLQILVVYPKVESLRSKVTSFIHRMVETLGVSVFPYLPKALEQLLADIEPKELVGVLVLLNQLICKFKTGVLDIVNEVFPIIIKRVFSVLPLGAIPCGPGSITEEVRELQELQRTLFTFLNVIATHKISSVFISPNSRDYFEPIVQLLLYSSCNHKDITVRKACVQIFIQLINDWCGSYGEEKVHGFQTFIVETFAIKCCLYSVMDKSFELRDANSNTLLGEIVTAQKVMYEKLGDIFLLNFSKGLQAVHCSQELAEQYLQKLQNNDSNALKPFYQSLIENLRQHQNGSLVFR